MSLISLTIVSFYFHFYHSTHDRTLQLAASSDKKEEEPMDSEAYQDPDNETGLFAGMVYEADDEEADRIYDSVDRKMDERRRARRYVRPSYRFHCIPPIPRTG